MGDKMEPQELPQELPQDGRMEAESSGSQIIRLPELEEEPLSMGTPRKMAERGSLLGTGIRESGDSGTELIGIVEGKPTSGYPGPDHDEPLRFNEKINIIQGYALGFALLAVAVALDWANISADLSDWAQRLHCGSGCPRDPECRDYSDMPGGENITTIMCPASVGNWMVWLGTVGAVGFNTLVSYCTGRLHQRNPTVWKVNYTRKISHFCMFMMQILVRYVVQLDDEIETVSTLIVTSTLYMMLYHLVLLKPFRKRFKWARVVFLSLDRPEDRPYTLRWLTTQNIAYYMVFTPLMYCLIAVDKFQLYFIPTLVVGLGDGLAEPVGVKWGKHKYTTRAIWYEGRCCYGKFTRSLEGSACVFIVTVLSIGIMANQFTLTQLGVAFGVLPISMTLAEAWSPHTWDTPFLFGVGGGLVFAITQLV